MAFPPFNMKFYCLVVPLLLYCAGEFPLFPRLLERLVQPIPDRLKLFLPFGENKIYFFVVSKRF